MPEPTETTLGNSLTAPSEIPVSLPEDKLYENTGSPEQSFPGTEIVDLTNKINELSIY